MLGTQALRSSRIDPVLVSLIAQAAVVWTLAAQNALPPEKVVKLEAAAVRFSDDIRRDDWTGATEQLQQITRAAGPLFNRPAAAASHLGKAIVRFMRAIHHQDRFGALHAANKIRLWATLEATSAPAAVAPQIARLGFLARELGIDLDERRETKAAAIIEAAQQCWDQLKPELEKRGDDPTIQEGDAVFHATAAGDAPKTLLQIRVGFSTLAEHLERQFDAPAR